MKIIILTFSELKIIKVSFQFILISIFRCCHVRIIYTVILFNIKLILVGFDA